MLDQDDKKTAIHLAIHSVQQVRSSFPKDVERLCTTSALPQQSASTRPTPQEENVLRYYGELFLGGAEEGAGHYDESRAAYERAAALFPTAQSPLLGLSELARRRGDRRSALDAMQKVFELPPLENDRIDPWWTYHVFQARDTERLLEQLWKPFKTAAGAQ